MTDIAEPIVRILSPKEVSPAGTHVKIQADEAQRIALARAADVISVEALAADLLVKPWSGSGFIVTGRVTARVTQACVVTLEPILATVDETIDMKFVPPEDMAKYEIEPDEDGVIDLDATKLDLPDPIENGVLDLGAIVREHLVLGLDPYPRKAGVVFDAAAVGADVPPEELSPFAALARLKKE